MVAELVASTAVVAVCLISSWSDVPVIATTDASIHHQVTTRHKASDITVTLDIRTSTNSVIITGVTTNATNSITNVARRPSPVVVPPASLVLVVVWILKSMALSPEPIPEAFAISSLLTMVCVRVPDASTVP